MDAALAVLPTAPSRLRAASIINRKAVGLKRAAVLLSQFTDSTPTNPETLLALGLAWALAGEKDSALSVSQKAVKLFPRLWQTHYNLGVAFGESGGGYGRELACYDAALRLKPDAFDVFLNKGKHPVKSGASLIKRLLVSSDAVAARQSCQRAVSAIMSGRL